MKILNVKLLVLVVFVQMTFSQSAMAALIGPTGWNGDNIHGFLGNSAFPGIEISTSTLDFSGEWMYTAIGRESGHTNDIDESGNPGVQGGDTSLTFTTNNYGNWGVWNTVDFDSENLFFEDSNGPWNVALDSLDVANNAAFKLFRLSENTTVTYLTGNASLSLVAGDIIVGFNDNHLNNSDGDFDDIIVAMRATSVAAPESFALFGLGLVGLGFVRRKTA